uniref:Uncharacterized protein n=1 Tax=viral metagenome TaxID=1070528 RepID=A0A6C0FBP1_9ZZZZ|tara:strand:+ start:5090 stop:5710 length:621 start_codon:yes stop_codon:yes gene_type:complete
MSNHCKYLTCDKLSLDKLNFKSFHCDDMSVTKSSEKTYSESKESHKDHPCFGYLQVYYLKNPMLYVTTPKMKCLFGVQNKGNGNFQMSLQFTDLEEDPYMKNFFEFIQSCEFYAMKTLGLTSEDADRFVSQIIYDKKEMYEPNLNVKLPFQYNQFLTDIYSEYSSGVNIFHIRKFQNMECDLYVDKIWRMNDKFYMKWKCKVIHVV